MENHWVYKKKHIVDFSDIDFMKRLKLSSLFSLLQDVSAEHVDKLGIGVDALKEKHNVAWILLRMRIEIERMPNLHEEIYIETWHHESRKMDFQRDYIVYDSKENIIARGISTWVIVDIENKSIKRTEVLGFDYEKQEKSALDYKLKSLKAPSNFFEVYKKRVGYSDIDFNEHINNSKYVDYATDCFELGKHKEYCVKEVEINYVNEAVPGDILTLKKDISALEDGELYLQGEKTIDSSPVFRARVKVRMVEDYL